MNDLSIKWFTAFNAFLIRASHGRIGSKLGTQSVLILHSIGRSSGEERTTPIAYFERDSQFLIVASNWGKEKNADWYLNLKKNPMAKLEVHGKLLPVTAREAVGQEYEELWQFVTKRHPPYLDYQKMTSRHIPIMVFEKL